MLNKTLITITALLFALLSVVPASAKIVGISATTKVLYPGEYFEVTFHTSDWIINVEEYYAVFGIEPEPATTGDLGLGTVLGNGYDLVAHGHAISGVGSFNVQLEIPKNFKPPHKSTKYQLKTAVLIVVRANLSSLKGP
jgi:hypothetical protein